MSGSTQYVLKQLKGALSMCQNTFAHSVYGKSNASSSYFSVGGILSSSKILTKSKYLFAENNTFLSMINNKILKIKMPVCIPFKGPSN